MKRTLWKDICRTLTRSWARFFSIFGLVALGTFALIGLKVTGPNMRTTALQQYEKQNLADIQVTSNFGFSSEDVDALKQLDFIQKIEFGYVVDTVIDDTTTSIRMFSLTSHVSTYEVEDGSLPTSKDEIAIDNEYHDTYKIGDTIHVNSKDSLYATSYKVVGYVSTVEIMDREQRGPTSVGTGELNTFGAILPEAFNQDVYTLARVRFNSTNNLDPFREAYTTQLEKNRKQLKQALDIQAMKRKQAIQDEKLPAIENAIHEVAMNLSMLELNPVKFSNEIVTTSAKLEALKQQQNQINTVQVTYNLYDRNTFPGYTLFHENSKRTDMLSAIFPTFLFAIAALVSLTTMTRMVDEQRLQSGTLKALGYSKADIRFKFIFYGLISSILGSILGIVAGHTILPKVIYEASTASFTMPDLKLFFYPFYSLVAVLISIFCIVGVTIWVVNHELKAKPATLLLPKSPKGGSRIFLERITFIWKHISFTYKVTARNIFRYKQRMLMTIFGVAGCTALLISGFGLRDSMSEMLQRQYQSIMDYDMLAIQNTQVEDSHLDSVQAIKGLSSEFVIQTKNINVYNLDNKHQSAQLMVFNDAAIFNKYISLLDKTTKKTLDTNKGTIISDKMATLLGVSVGDTIKVKVGSKQYQLKISGINEMYVGHYVFMNSKTYEHIFNDIYSPNAFLIKLKSNHDANYVASQLMAMDAIQTVQQSNQIEATIDAIIVGLDKVISVLIICAIMLAMIVVFNLTNINVSERIRELSTIKVLGFYPKEVTLYIYRETIILSIVGILVGFGIGYILHQMMVLLLPPETVMFYPNLLWSNLVLSSLITLTITLVIMVIMHIKLKRIQMLDALKSME